MNRATGELMGLLEHLRQSVADILTTPFGSRVMRRDYGSLLPDLIDQPFNNATRVQLYAATVMALMRWEPRVRLSRVQLWQGEVPGSAILELEGTQIDGNEPFSLTAPLKLGAAQ